MVLFLTFFPALCLGSSYVVACGIKDAAKGLDEITINIVQTLMRFDSVSTLFLVMFIVTWVFGILVILLSLAFDCCICCNVMLIRAQRIQEGNRYKFTRALFTIMALGVYIPPAINCYITYSELHNFDVTQTEITKFLSNYNNQRTWDKVQIWFDCCGVNNYTYWYSHQDVLPDSCCKNYSPGCGNFTSLDQINERGCVSNVAFHVNEQFKCQTEDSQTLFAFAFSGLIIGCFAILICCWYKSIVPIKCCSRIRADQDDELIDDGNIEANHEEQRLIQNRAVRGDDGDNIGVDDTIINIEDDNIDNDAHVNGEVNRIVEMNDVLDVHQNNAEDDDVQLLE